MPVETRTSTWRAAAGFGVRALLVFNVTTAAFAATVTRINDDALAPLRASVVAKKIRLDRLPLYDNKRSVIELEEFQVWAPDGKVAIHSDSGVRYLAPPPMRFFRGLVNGDLESFAFFSVDGKTGRIEGLVDTRDMKFAVTAQRRRSRPGAPTLAPVGEEVDYFLTAADANDALQNETGNWVCALDQRKIEPVLDRPIRPTGKDGLPIKANGISGTQSYAITLEVETDFEFYQNALSDVTTATNYITNLTGALSTIYNRDLKTNVVLGPAVNIYTSVSDPWSAASAGPGLDELGNYYHNVVLKPAGRTTSAVAMLSGKATLAGIAWVGTICGSDNPQGGTFSGPYSWNGGIGNPPPGLGTIPDPNATNSQGTLYGLPNGTQNYWPLIQFSHELGHNFGSPHTHCMTISQAEFVASLFTDGTEAFPMNTANHFIDHCRATEGAGCFAGTDFLAGSQTFFKGTIMSYCHILSSGGIRQSRFTFGVTGQPSQHVYDDYLLRPMGPLSGGLNIVTGVGSFTISAITAPATVPASSTGNAANISAIVGATYAWTISNGSITGGQTTNAITFTAGASGTVTLRATAYGTDRCGVTDTKSVIIGGAPPPAPTNVVATAATPTSVSVTWTLAIGATSYRVYRSSGGAYAQLAGTPAAPPFTDTTALANTAYVYKVHSHDGSAESGDSNVDLATTVIFTDPTLTPASTSVKAAHFTQMRTAVNAVQTLASQGNTPYTDVTLDSTVNVKGVHSTELRTRLNAARAAITGLSPATFTNTIIAGTTVINALDMNELRAGVQ